MEPLLPLHVGVNQHFPAIACVHPRESPTLFIHIPFLLNVDNVADSPRTNDVSHRKRIWLATMLRSHLNDLFGLFDQVARLDGLGENVGEWLFHVAILASLYNFCT